MKNSESLRDALFMAFAVMLAFSLVGGSLLHCKTTGSKSGVSEWVFRGYHRFENTEEACLDITQLEPAAPGSPLKLFIRVGGMISCVAYTTISRIEVFPETNMWASSSFNFAEKPRWGDRIVTEGIGEEKEGDEVDVEVPIPPNSGLISQIINTQIHVRYFALWNTIRETGVTIPIQILSPEERKRILEQRLEHTNTRLRSTLCYLALVAFAPLIFMLFNSVLPARRRDPDTVAFESIVVTVAGGVGISLVLLAAVWDIAVATPPSRPHSVFVVVVAAVAALVAGFFYVVGATILIKGILRYYTNKRYSSKAAYRAKLLRRG